LTPKIVPNSSALWHIDDIGILAIHRDKMLPYIIWIPHKWICEEYDNHRDR